jgi:hypothetical protein
MTCWVGRNAIFDETSGAEAPLFFGDCGDLPLKKKTERERLLPRRSSKKN